MVNLQQNSIEKNNLFESVFRKKPVTDIRDLPVELIKKIAEYKDGDIEFNPNIDIGPLEPKHILEHINLEDVQNPRTGEWYQSALIANDNVLRKNQQGPKTERDTKKSFYDIRNGKLEKIIVEEKLLTALFGEKHPSVQNLKKKRFHLLISDLPI